MTSPERTNPALRVAAATAVHLLALAAVAFLAYANAFDHAFNLDSLHVAVDNPGVRDLALVPEFFVDPGTFSSLRSNVDYRPVLQITYALDYALGEYRMAQWHTTQLALHVACVVGLYFLARRVLELAASPKLELGSPEARRIIAFAAALVFAAHPANAGVIDYVSARSSLLTAALLLPALLAYMRPVDDERYDRPALLSALFFGLAIFAKVEAVACIGVFFLFDVWQTSIERGQRSGFVADAARTLRLRTLRRLAPVLVVAAVYFVARDRAMAPFEYGEASRRADVTNFEYLISQTVAWWHYVGRWFLAVEFVADDARFPVHRSLLDPQVLAAIGAWLVVAGVVLSQWRRRPYLAFLTISALALVSPTSSFVPLAELVNEHRPYLPLAVLSLTWTIELGARVATSRRVWTAVASAAGLLVLVTALTLQTRERNGVFATHESYWRDVLDKAPSQRAHVNYGLTFLARGEYPTALEHFLAALELGPYWHITHSNLAVAYENLGNVAKATEHHDRAVDYDKFSGTSLTLRGEFRLRRGDHAGAAADFRASMSKSLERLRNWRGLATALAGMGDATGCFEAIERCVELSREETEASIVAILTPFFGDASRYAAGIELLELLDRGPFPDTWWVHENIAILAQRLGRDELADAARARASELRADEPVAPAE